MSIIVGGLLTPKLTTGGYGKAATVFGSISLPIENQVTPTDKYVPLTGVYAVDDSIGGWHYDLKRLGAANLVQTLYNTWLGGHAVGLLDGTALEDWQSGWVSGLKLLGWTGRRLSDDLTWTPVYETGSFSIYWDVRSLYSDYSYSAVVDSRLDTVNGHVVSLRGDAVYESITATLYKRDAQARILAVDEIELVDVLTGVLDGGARVEADDGETILWDQVETRKKEMVVRDGELLFNQVFTKEVGVPEITPYSVTRWESHGPGLTSGRNLYLGYFPVQEDSARLVTQSGVASAVTEWTEKSNLNFSRATDRHFSVNYDLGIVITGGFSAPDLTLAYDIDQFAAEIACIVDAQTFDQYPDQGIIVIGSEEIIYTGKERSSFIGCTRGANGTTALDYNKGEAISDIQHGMGTTDTLFMAYSAVPRVEYEVTGYNLRTANRSRWLDLRPLVNTRSNNIVQLVSQEKSLNTIVLETDDELVGGNVYGPVYFGTDVSRLVATAYDGMDNRVDDLDLTIEILSGSGTLNGRFVEYSDITNSAGEISCLYNSPYDKQDMSLQINSIEYVGADTHITINDLQQGVLSPSDVWLFQVLKHDPIQGTTGHKSTGFRVGAATPPHGYATVDVYTPYSEEYVGGIIIYLNSSGVRLSFNILAAEFVDPGMGYDGPGTRFYLDRYLDPGSLPVGGADVWLFEPGAEQWDSGLKRGTNVIVYQWNDSVQHPVTGDAGAYYPVHPDEISGTVLIYKNMQLPLPDPDDVANNIGAYSVIAPTQVRLEAHGRDPYSGKLITSNQIRLQLRLPNSLIGVDSSGALPIPQGWTLVTDEVNVGVGIGGANFITINPAASGINQFSLTGAI